jgi:hypothetical protein
MRQFVMPILSATFSSVAESNLAIQHLNDRGIDARVADSASSSLTERIRLYVSEVDFERAESLFHDVYPIPAPASKAPKLSVVERWIENWELVVVALFVVFAALSWMSLPADSPESPHNNPLQTDGAKSSP